MCSFICQRNTGRQQVASKSCYVSEAKTGITGARVVVRPLSAYPSVYFHF